MHLTTGAQLRSQACTTKVIVIRAPQTDEDLRCGGHPMLALEAEPAAGLTLEPGSDTGAQLGKRYVAPGRDDLEVLVTAQGEGTLALADAPLEVRPPKPLPASD